LSREFTTKRLGELTEKSSRPIKLLMMDQKRIAGIGNIQAAEALFRARIHPEHAANTLARDEVARLARSIRSSLRSEIERSRSETLTYLQAGGENLFVVYGRAGKPCSRCKTSIAKLVQGGRSTYYCPACQPSPKRK